FLTRKHVLTLLLPLLQQPPFFSTNPTPSCLYTHSLHDALPISSHDPELRLDQHGHPPERRCFPLLRPRGRERAARNIAVREDVRDRKSTRLNSSHVSISYAVFCLKKKTNASALRPHIALAFRCI